MPTCTCPSFIFDFAIWLENIILIYDCFLIMCTYFTLFKICTQYDMTQKIWSTIWWKIRNTSLVVGVGHSIASAYKVTIHLSQAINVCLKNLIQCIVKTNSHDFCDPFLPWVDFLIPAQPHLQSHHPPKEKKNSKLIYIAFLLYIYSKLLYTQKLKIK